MKVMRSTIDYNGGMTDDVQSTYDVIDNVSSLDDLMTLWPRASLHPLYQSYASNLSIQVMNCTQRMIRSNAHMWVYVKLINQE